MYRIHILASALLATCLVASAGQVQLGGSSGLTLSYVTGSSTTGSAAASNPALGSSKYTEKNYNARLYMNAAYNGTPVSPTFSSGTYSKWNGQSAASITDSTDYTSYGGPTSVKFSMLSDSCNALVHSCLGASNTSNSNLSNSFYGETTNTSGPATIIIPVGVYGVTDVWTMLNDLWGSPSTLQSPVSTTSITFNFSATSATATSFDDVVSISLFNSLSGTGSSAFGQIRAGLNCTSANTSVSQSGIDCATAFANGPLAPVSSLATTVTTNSGTTNTTTTVLTKQLSSVAYNWVGSDQSGSASAYTGSQGSAVLDSQGFMFGNLYSSLYLVSIQIANSNGLSNGSQFALSAITVDTASSAPEPSTIIMVAGGLAAVALSRRRRRS